MLTVMAYLLTSVGVVVYLFMKNLEWPLPHKPYQIEIQMRERERELLNKCA
jgi:hypothetical protein